MIRRLLILGSLTSLLLSLLLIALWVRSYFRLDSLVRSRIVTNGRSAVSESYSAECVAGGIQLRRQLWTTTKPEELTMAVARGTKPKWSFAQWRREADRQYPFDYFSPPSGGWSRLGFACGHGRRVRPPWYTVERWSFTFPIWSPTTLSLAAGVPFLLSWWKVRSRRRRGCCLACGYDLRATSGRCPECGALPNRGPRV